MAFNVSVIQKTTFGNKKVNALSCVADSAEGQFTTGLGVPEWFSFGPISMSTGASGGPRISLNELSSGTASVGFVSVTGVTSGDVFYLTVFGH